MPLAPTRVRTATATVINSGAARLAETSGGILSSLSKTPLDKLQASEDSAKKDVEKARVAREGKEKALADAESVRQSTVEKILASMQEIDQQRVRLLACSIRN